MSATHVISTAGHVDHGKSTLVRALTGTDPDRLAEEKARGLTIDLGFASVDLPTGRTLAIVDVPGHVRFLRNMLAGVGAVDACLFVVSAPEGWKPQSEEHLRILEMLGLGHGVIALTHIDVVDDEVLELARLDIADRVEGTFLEDAPVIGVDSISGRGLDRLTQALEELADATPQAADAGRPRMWIDRVFAAKGSGTVVTGTLTGGAVAVDDELEILPDGHEVRVRGIQSLHSAVDSVGPGHRVALNLTGVSHDQLRRGDVLVAKDQWFVTSVVDASLSVLADLDHPVSRRGAHVAYFGSREVPVALRVLGPERLDPGEAGAVRLRFDGGLPLVPGDRFVVRESGRGETIGGGVVLDVDPQLPASKAAPDRTVERVVRERGYLDVGLARLLTGDDVEATAGRWVIDPKLAETRVHALADGIDNAGAVGLDVAGLDELDRELLTTIDGVRVEGGRASRGPVVDPFADHPFIGALDADPFQPPSPDGYDRAEVRELVRRGLIVESEGLYFSADAVALGARRVAEMLASQPEGVTVAEVREALGTSRKYAMPLLSYFDANGITRRRDDVRIGGPRLPEV